jgi:hypothetical protein
MQSYIEESKKNKQNPQNVSKEPCKQSSNLSSNDFINERYSKKTNELGE